MPEEIPFVKTEVATPEELAAMRKTVTKVPVETGIGAINNGVFFPIIGVRGDGTPIFYTHPAALQEVVNPDEFDLEEVFD